MELLLILPLVCFSGMSNPGMCIKLGSVSENAGSNHDGKHIYLTPIPVTLAELWLESRLYSQVLNRQNKRYMQVVGI
jgi:hypothetical protein